MNPPHPGVYTIRMRYQFGAQDTVWRFAYWSGTAWHLPPFYSFLEWLQ